MNRFIHYHNVTVLIPDGRVIASGGAGLTANNSFAGDDMSIETFEPPYLFRGIRPKIKNLSTFNLRSGSSLSFELQHTRSPTAVVLVSARAATHWVDGGPQRYLQLPFTRNASTIMATIPEDNVAALSGYYMLFALVDDIPSEGKIVRILPAGPAGPIEPEISISSSAAMATEGGGPQTFEISRTGDTSAPLRVNLLFSGTALGGADFAAPPAYVIIPAGSSSVLTSINPLQDGISEGLEKIRAAVVSSVAYQTSPQNFAEITLLDADPEPPAPQLFARLLSNGNLELTYSGPASRIVSFEQSSNLDQWVEFTSGFATTNELRLILQPGASRLFFRIALLL